MNADEYIAYVDDINELSKANPEALAKIVALYPYFQTNWLLYIKALHYNKSLSFSIELKKAATYSGDRSLLYNLIKKELEDRKIPSGSLISKVEIKESPQIIEEKLIHSVSNDDYFLLDFDYSIDETVSVENKGNLSPTMSDYAVVSSDYLASYDDLIKSNTNSKEPIQKESKDLIEEFIKKQPKIKPKPVADEEIEDISENSVKENDFMSETLAEIYMKQKNYAKAIDIYEKLSLKYPKKSIYFATQISYIKTLIQKK